MNINRNVNIEIILIFNLITQLGSEKYLYDFNTISGEKKFSIKETKTIHIYNVLSV